MSVKDSTDAEFKKCVMLNLGHFQVYFCREPQVCPGILKNMNELKIRQKAISNYE